MSGLACRGIRVRVGDADVLRDLTLEVPDGSRVALVGPSGAGKTTLLRAIAGLVAPIAGTIALDGRPLDALPPHRRGIAVVFQEPRLLPHLDVLDNVALPLRAAGARRDERRARALEALGEVGLDTLAARRVGGLSGGEQQRVALARALVAEPRLLLLDEPLAALDPNRRDELRRLLVGVQEARRLTTVIVTHDRAEAAELGRTIAVMLDGRIAQHDDPRVVFEQPRDAAVARFFGVANLVPDGDGLLAIRPEHLRLTPDAALRTRVVEATYLGDHVRVLLDADGLPLRAHRPVHDAPAVGAEVGVDLDGSPSWRIPG